MLRQAKLAFHWKPDMRSPKSVEKLEALGRVRLSPNFFMRDFLYSEIANFHGLANIPEDPELAIAAGTKLCEELLEPLNETFGRIAVRSAYRSSTLNAFGHAKGNLGCASNEANYAGHIWDRRDAAGRMGATACIVIPWFADLYEQGRDWRAMAWWVHDHLPYSSMEFSKPAQRSISLGGRSRSDGSIITSLRAASRRWAWRVMLMIILNGIQIFRLCECLP